MPSCSVERMKAVRRRSSMGAEECDDMYGRAGSEGEGDIKSDVFQDLVGGFGERRRPTCIICGQLLPATELYSGHKIRSYYMHLHVIGIWLQ